MTTLELAMPIIAKWVQGGCVGSCEVVITPPSPAEPVAASDTAPSGTLSSKPIHTAVTPPSTKWVEDTTNAIAANFITFAKKVSIQCNGATYTFTMTAVPQTA
jgi:hypothetical protein